MHTRVDIQKRQPKSPFFERIVQADFGHPNSRQILKVDLQLDVVGFHFFRILGLSPQSDWPDMDLQRVPSRNSP